MRNHRSLEVKLERGLTLITGPSGRGKSTIFDAIEWALYGGNMSNILPDDCTPSKSLHCAVELTLDSMYVYREKSPHNRLLVRTPKGAQLVDKEGQAYIEGAFGEYDVWVATSYVRQKGAAYLLTATSSQKLALLNQLAFRDEDPSIKIQQIDAELQKAILQVTNTEASYNTECALVNQEIQRTGAKAEWRLTPVALADNTARLQSLQLRLPELRGSYLEGEKQRAQMAYIEGQITKVKELLLFLDKGEKRSLSDIQREISLTQEAIKNAVLLSEYNALSSKITSNSQNGTLVNQGVDERSEEELLKLSIEAKQVEDIIETGKRICRMYGIDYKQETIDARVRELEAVISKELVRAPMYALSQKKAALAKSVSDLRALNLPKVTEEQLTLVERMVSTLRIQHNDIQRELMHAKELLKCPSCGVSLKYQSGDLKQSNSAGVDIDMLKSKENEYSRLIAENTSQFVKLRATIADGSRLDALEKELLNLKDVPDNVDAVGVDVYALRTQVAHLGSVKFPTLKSSSDELKEKYEQKKIHNKLAELRSRLPTQLPSYINPDDLQKRMSDLQMEARKVQEIEHLNSQLMEHHVSLHRLKSTCPATCKEDITKCESQISELSKILSQHNVIESLYPRTLRLNEQYQLLNNLKEEVKLWTEFKQLAVKVEYETLDTLVSNINDLMAELLSHMFVDPIQVSIRTSRELKAGGHKAQVNTQVEYRGKQKEFKRLSGGEQDRISLALALALASFSSFPYVLLDEVTNSIGPELKDICLKRIREVCSKKSVMMIDIGAIEGYYDRVYSP